MTKRTIPEYQPRSFKDIAETNLGQKLWGCINEDDTVLRLETASDLGHPAVAGIEELLLERFGDERFSDRIKQCIGHMVRQVMEAEGYEVDRHNVSISSTLFSKGTRYRRPEWQRLQVFRNTKNHHDLCFSNSRDVNKLPQPKGDGRWHFRASFCTILRGHIVYGINVRAVRAEVAERGYAMRSYKRFLRAR